MSCSAVSAWPGPVRPSRCGDATIIASTPPLHDEAGGRAATDVGVKGTGPRARCSRPSPGRPSGSGRDLGCRLGRRRRCRCRRWLRPRAERDGPIRPCPDDRARRRGAGQHLDDLLERPRRSPRHEPGDPPGISSRPGKTVWIEAWPEEESLPATGARSLAAGDRASVDPADRHLERDHRGPLRPRGRSLWLASLRLLSHSRTRFADGDRRCVARAPARIGGATPRGRRRVVRGPPLSPR
jgi:hypothetical protein